MKWMLFLVLIVQGAPAVTKIPVETEELCAAAGKAVATSGVTVEAWTCFEIKS